MGEPTVQPGAVQAVVSSAGPDEASTHSRRELTSTGLSLRSAIQWRDIVPSARPGAGAVPGRWGACLAVRTPPAALHFVKSPIRTHHFAARGRHGVPPGRRRSRSGTACGRCRRPGRPGCRRGEPSRPASGRSCPQTAWAGPGISNRGRWRRRAAGRQGGDREPRLEYILPGGFMGGGSQGKAGGDVQYAHTVPPSPNVGGRAVFEQRAYFSAWRMVFDVPSGKWPGMRALPCGIRTGEGSFRAVTRPLTA